MKIEIDVQGWRALAAMLELHGVNTDQALRELWLVHRIETARLLREAAILRARSTWLGDLFVVEPRSLTESGWRDRAARHLALAELDALERCSMLCRVACSAFEAWPSATTLANRALGIVESAEGRLCLHAAEVAAGELALARRGLEELTRRDLTESVRPRAFASAALAAQAAGDHASALDRFERSAFAPRSGIDPLVSMFALAVRCADDARAAASLARLRSLDLSVDGVRGRWERALDRTSSRVEWERAAGRVILSRDGARLGARLAHASPTIARPVIEALL